MSKDKQDNQWHSILFYTVTLIVLVADQLSKIGIRASLAIGESIPETGFIHLTRVQNTGAAFGIFYGHTFPLTIASFLGIIIILFYAFSINRHFPLLNHRLGSVVLGIILGGTTGNLIDRLRFGSVTDFIDIGPWPSFNVADSCITVGVIIFAYTLLASIRAEKSSNS